MNYFFHQSAEKEHLESVAFYETKQAGLCSSYLLEFENAIVTRPCCTRTVRLSPELKHEVFNDRIL